MFEVNIFFYKFRLNILIDLNSSALLNSAKNIPIIEHVLCIEELYQYILYFCHVIKIWFMLVYYGNYSIHRNTCAEGRFQIFCIPVHIWRLTNIFLQGCNKCYPIPTFINF